MQAQSCAHCSAFLLGSQTGFCHDSRKGSAGTDWPPLAQASNRATPLRPRDSGCEHLPERNDGHGIVSRTSPAFNRS